MEFFAIVVAAGSGQRAGPGAPKAWRSLAGRAIVRWSVEALLNAGAAKVVVVVAKDRLSHATDSLAGLDRWEAVQGGENRADSVRAGMAALPAEPHAIVLVHDAARPFLTAAHVQRLLAALEACDGAILALPVADTLKRGDAIVDATVPRNGLWRAQTPQAFPLSVLRSAYANWPSGEEPTDDASIVERAGGRVALVPGDPMLMKLTYPEDFEMAEQLAGSLRQVRTGFGVDAHRFGPGDKVWIGGVPIAHERALVGHSDADAALHALTDALLGTIGAGDIGEHFPPSDPTWKGATSDRFLTHAAGLLAARGGRIVNLDLTVICERPKIGPHREAIRQRIAEIVGLAVDQVSVKATTMEGMGFTGRDEGLLAQAIATVELPV